MTATPNRARVVIVAYCDEIHVYDEADDAADVVYTVAVGANLDAERRTISVAAWDMVRDVLAADHTIADHRT